MPNPDFLILGAMKAGTGSLWTYLCNHPQLYPAHLDQAGWLKESGYFGVRHSILEPDDYEFLYRNKKNGQLSFEASTEYLTFPGTPERVRDANPDCKFIILLRSPVDRAWSHYWHEVIYTEEEKLPFEQAIQRPLITEFDHFHYAYLSIGRYMDHISRWMEFFDADHFLFLNFDYLKENPDGLFRTVLNWLGVKDGKLAKYELMNKGTYTKKMRKETRKKLTEYFDPWNKLLSDITKMEFAWA